MKTSVMIILVLLSVHRSLLLSVELLLLSVVYPENPNIVGMMPLVVYYVVPVHYLCYWLPHSTVVVAGLLRIHS